MGKIIIDLNGPRGSAHSLIALAESLGRHLGKNIDEITREMTVGDYGYLLEIFQQNFGEYVEFAGDKKITKENAPKFI